MGNHIMVSKAEVQRIRDAVKGRYGERSLSRRAVELARDKNNRYFAGQLHLDSLTGDAKKPHRSRSPESF
jgi:hypothetical protein